MTPQARKFALHPPFYLVVLPDGSVLGNHAFIRGWAARFAEHELHTAGVAAVVQQTSWETMRLHPKRRALLGSLLVGLNAPDQVQLGTAMALTLPTKTAKRIRAVALCEIDPAETYQTLFEGRSYAPVYASGIVPGVDPFVGIAMLDRDYVRWGRRADWFVAFDSEMSLMMAKLAGLQVIQHHSVEPSNVRA